MHYLAREGSPSSGSRASESSKMTVFTMVSATFVQKWQYKVFWQCSAEIAIFTRFCDAAAQKSEYLQGFLTESEIWNLNSEIRNPKVKIWNLQSEIRNTVSGIWNLKSAIWKLEVGTRNLKSEIWNLKYEIRNMKFEI